MLMIEHALIVSVVSRTIHLHRFIGARGQLASRHSNRKPHPLKIPRVYPKPCNQPTTRAVAPRGPKPCLASFCCVPPPALHTAVERGCWRHLNYLPSAAFFCSAARHISTAHVLQLHFGPAKQRRHGARLTDSKRNKQRQIEERERRRTSELLRAHDGRSFLLRLRLLGARHLREERFSRAPKDKLPRIHKPSKLANPGYRNFPRTVFLPFC